HAIRRDDEYADRGEQRDVTALHRQSRAAPLAWRSGGKDRGVSGAFHGRLRGRGIGPIAPDDAESTEWKGHGTHCPMSVTDSRAKSEWCCTFYMKPRRSAATGTFP